MEPIGMPRGGPSALVALARPAQWTKNLVVLAALLFSRDITHTPEVLSALRTLAAFCLLSSAVYSLNDVLDAEQDRGHPVKRHRPVASGRVSPRAALCSALILGVAALAVAATANRLVASVALTYALVNITYSRYLKHFVILDVMLVSSGFVLRAVAGAAAVRASVSPWLLLCTILLSLFLALCKRRSEFVALQSGGGAMRKVLESYSLPLLDQMIASTTAATIMSYCFYSFSSPTAHNTPYLMLTIPFVIYGVFRYLYLVYKAGQGGEPDRVFLTDRPLQLDMVLWVIAAASVLYFT